MALKMDRQVDAVDISYFLDEVAEAGVIVSVSTAGSGISMDNLRSVATVKAVASGSRPLGMLLNDFVDIDLTRNDANHHKDESAVGSKCTILTKGWAVTNKVLGTVTGVETAVLAASGNISGVAFGTPTSVTAPRVGQFRSGKNEAGYAKVYIDL